MSNKITKIAGIVKANPILFWIVGLILVIGIFSGTMAVYILLSDKDSAKNSLSQVSANLENQTNGAPQAVTIPDLNGTTGTSSEAVNDAESQSGEWNIDEEKYFLTIQWQKTQEVDITQEFSELFKEQNDESEAIASEKLYKKGTVKSGKFAGYNIYSLQTNIDGMCFGRCLHGTILLASDKGAELYVVMSTDGAYTQPEYFGYDGYLMPVKVYNWLKTNSTAALAQVKINNLINYPDTMQLADGKLVFRLENYDSTPMSQCDLDSCLGEKHIATSKQGDAFFSYNSPQGIDTEGALYIYNELGMPFAYGSLIDGIESDLNSGRIQWNNEYEQKDTKYLPYRPGSGCGWHNAIDLLSQKDLNVSDLIVVGKTSDGESVYVPKDPKNNQDVLFAYDGWMQYETQEKPSFDEFLKDHPTPVFYWQDVLGRWVRYTEYATHPLGECGKPVIYLYPETTTNVSVKLPNFIQVTVSDPAYPQAGWNVIANPDGSLIYPADGKTYGSLFWEGIGAGYARPEQGWVIKDGEQENFLAEILPKYGLNTREAQEFMDFWLSEMQGAKYYRISFLTDLWDSAAPLYVTPAPDTNIRIFMDWQKIDAPRQISPPDVVTPERKGFTLVEWGGVLYK